MNFNDLPEEIRIFIYSFLDLENIFNMRLLDKKNNHSIMFNMSFLNILIHRAFEKFPNYDSHFKDMSSKNYYTYQYFQIVYLVGRHAEDFSLNNFINKFDIIENFLNNCLNSDDDKEEIHFLFAWLYCKRLSFCFVDYINDIKKESLTSAMNNDFNLYYKKLSQSISSLNPLDSSPTFSSTTNFLFLLFLFHKMTILSNLYLILSKILAPYYYQVKKILTSPEFKNKIMHSDIFNFLLSKIDFKTTVSSFNMYLALFQNFHMNESSIRRIAYLIDPKSFPLLMRAYQANRVPNYSNKQLSVLAISNQSNLFSILTDDDIIKLDPYLVCELSHIKNLKQFIIDVPIKDIEKESMHFIPNYKTLGQLSFLNNIEKISLSRCRCFFSDDLQSDLMEINKDPFCLNEIFSNYKNKISNLERIFSELSQNKNPLLQFLYPLYTTRIKAILPLQTKDVEEIMELFGIYGPTLKSKIPMDQYYDPDINDAKTNTNVKFTKNIDSIMWLYANVENPQKTLFFQFLKENLLAIGDYANDKFFILAQYPNSTIFKHFSAYLTLHHTSTSTLLKLLKCEINNYQQFSIILHTHHLQTTYFQKYEHSKDCAITMEHFQYSAMHLNNNNYNQNDILNENTRLNIENAKLFDEVQNLKRMIKETKAQLSKFNFFSDDNKKRKQTIDTSDKQIIVRLPKKYFKKG